MSFVPTESPDASPDSSRADLPCVASPTEERDPAPENPSVASPTDPRPLAGHAILFSIFNAGAIGLAVAQWRSRRPLPDRIPASDIALLTVATYKVSRVITKDKITDFLRSPFTRHLGESERPSEVREEARGTGIRRATGELLVCPYCLGEWVGTAFLAAYLREPRLTRTVATLFTIVSAADLLQEGWVTVDKRA